jgi:hypothetical protein
MGASLPNDEPLYGSPANGAWLAAAIVDSKVILELPAAIYPIDAGAVPANSLPQDDPDGMMQALSLPAGDAPR